MRHDPDAETPDPIAPTLKKRTKRAVVGPVPTPGVPALKPNSPPLHHSALLKAIQAVPDFTLTFLANEAKLDPQGIREKFTQFAAACTATDWRKAWSDFSTQHSNTPSLQPAPDRSAPAIAAPEPEAKAGTAFPVYTRDQLIRAAMRPNRYAVRSVILAKCTHRNLVDVAKQTFGDGGMGAPAEEGWWTGAKGFQCPTTGTPRLRITWPEFIQWCEQHWPELYDHAGPIPADLVNQLSTHNYQLPQGYILDGENYVWKPAPPSATSAASDQSDQSDPTTMKLITFQPQPAAVIPVNFQPAPVPQPIPIAPLTPPINHQLSTINSDLHPWRRRMLQRRNLKLQPA